MRNLGRRDVLRTGVASTGALTLAGCTNFGDGGSDESLKLGILAPLSGPAEGIGPRFKNAAEIAIRVYPEEYGVLADTEIEIAVRNTESNPEAGRAGAEELILDEAVDVLIGTALSNVGIAVTGLAARENVPFVPFSVARSMTQEDCQRTTFRVHPHTGQTARIAANYLLDNIGQTGYLVYPDYGLGRQSRDGLKAVFDERGGEFVAIEAVPLDIDEWRPVLDDIESASDEIDFVINESTVAPLIRYLLASTNFDINVPLFSGSLAPEFIGALTQDQFAGLDDVIGTIYYAANIDNERSNLFAREYQNEHDTPPPQTAGMPYVNTEFALQVYDQADSFSTEDFIATAEEITTETVIGTSPVRACDHQGTPPSRIGQYTGIDEEHNLGRVEIQQTVDSADFIDDCEDVPCEF